MNIKKYIVSGCVALLGLGVSSCVGDLDLKPNDPNYVDSDSPNFAENSLAMCYAGIASEGYSGPGSSYVEGVDGGASSYIRVIFMLSEYCADEMIWIWPNDEGGQLGDIIAATWSNNNSILNATYYRLLGHIAICNQYLTYTKDLNDAESIEYKAEARVLRAYSYYNMIDLFGQSSFITEEAELGEEPKQYSRVELFNWLESELKDIVDNRLISDKPLYGRVGLDGAEALLAKLYLNAEVYTGQERWADCQVRCENIINRHQGTGFQGTGLAEHYLYLFQRDNHSYMPGGDKPGENEILFGMAYDDTYTQSYGGSTFLIAGPMTDTNYIPKKIYGTESQWSCMRARYQMAQRFGGDNTDVRDDLWVKGNLPAKNVEYVNVNNPDLKKTVEYAAEDYSDTFHGFTGEWSTTGGNAIIKFTGRTRNAAEDGGWDMELVEDREYLDASGNPYTEWKVNFPATSFASTDVPIIRLADIYLMYAECYISGHVGDATKALTYVNYIRRRAGVGDWGASQLTINNLMEERSRELYMESVRRSDLIRNGMFAGPRQTVWQFKGNINLPEGTRISDRNNLYPIPYNVLTSQPDFKQNPGY